MNTTDFTQNLISEASFVTEEISSFVNDLNPVQFNWKPAKDKWSIGQVLDHINKSNSYYLKELERILIEGKLKPAGDKRIKTGFLGSIALQAIEPGNNKKHKSHQLFEPFQNEVPFSVIEEFFTIQDVLTQYLQMLAAFDLSSAKVSSPANRLIRFRVGDFLSLIITHEKRHLLQIKNIFEMVEFPVAVK